ncbi:hypothetical protein CgunFtcFv8_004763 [Champsocephalus gunnari]|uniref:Uncharacterized protein n=1 Tax=Champsocephalus gunnari TaxID=52237 RepID=A0AAN8E5V5_CHAGU|nr:hypothetical protein CgunFtcFv8_004763 [Champsocephalus gunnari]
MINTSLVRLEGSSSASQSPNPKPRRSLDASSIRPDQQSQRMNFTFSAGRFDSAAFRQCYISSKACTPRPIRQLAWLLVPSPADGSVFNRFNDLAVASFNLQGFQ